jgi:hypothetical protein
MLQKMGVLYTHSPKRPGPFSKLPQKILKKEKKKGTWSDEAGQASGWRATAGRRSATGWSCPLSDLCPFFLNFFFSSALHFLRKWSTLVGWLQHMPALPRVHLKTSNTHNF